MATFNFKELFSNQFRKDGTLKARNTIGNYMRCLHNRYTNITILANFRIFLNSLGLSTRLKTMHQEAAEVGTIL